ncbi:MAG TPA: LysR family transcriptional regulator [Bryobacteraceae bacterium]|jgi:DNA-binding transcriptional LysR family regulator|nr:LysR family transcriptional regulator [Bryobacteraceae bacterium]
MDIRQIEIFLAVMEYGSVTRAAEHVYLSPGAVSLQLHHLALELHAELFVRSGKRFLPTPAAERLADLAKTVVSQMRAIEQEFANDPILDVRPFHLATGATTLIHRLGRPLRLLRKKYPHAQIQVTVSPTEEMVAGLLDRQFDLAVISLPFEAPNLEVLPLFEEELLILRPSNKPCRSAKIRDISQEELASAGFLLYPRRSNMRAIIESFFHELAITPQVIMEADDTEVIKKLVETGFGYSILPESALQDSPSFFEIFRVHGRRIVRSQALAMVKSEYPRALTVSIAKFLQSTLASNQSARSVHLLPPRQPTEDENAEERSASLLRVKT